MSQSDLKEIVPIVIVLLALLLGLLLRSVVAPLYLVATVLLSYFAALGIAVLIFQIAGGPVRAELRAAVPAVHLPDGAGRGLQHPGHEPDPGGGAACAAARRGPDRGAPHRDHGDLGRADPGRDLRRRPGVTGATSQIKQLGAAIALGVLIDTFLVRTLMVPAIVVLCRRYNWWPSHLARRSAEAAAEAGGSSRPAAVKS